MHIVALAPTQKGKVQGTEVWSKDEDQRHHPKLCDHQQDENQVKEKPWISYALPPFFKSTEADNELQHKQDAEDILHHLEHRFCIHQRERRVVVLEIMVVTLL